MTTMANIADTTLHAHLQTVVQQHPQQIFARVREGEKVVEVTYQEFFQLAGKVAQRLISMGIKPNDKVALVLENRSEWGSIYFGILMSGAIAVPLDLQSSLDDLKFFCHDAECQAIFVARSVAERMRQAVLDADGKMELQKIIVLGEVN